MFELTAEHNFRKDLHYHVIAGSGIWMPKDIGHPDSVHLNLIYPDKYSAHKIFMGFVKAFSNQDVGEEDFKESFEVWDDIVGEVEQEHNSEVITFLGLEYYYGAFPLSLIACNGCLPYGMN